MSQGVRVLGTVSAVVVAVLGVSGCGRKPQSVSAPPPPPRIEYYGVVREFGGQVTVGGRAAAVGMRVRNGERVRVAKGYAVVATVPRGDLVRIFSETVTEFVAAGPSPRLRLGEGKLWLTVRKLGTGQRFQVETVNAVAGVRGTDFLIERKGETTRVGVMEGSVRVADRRGNEVVLKPNEQTKVVSDRPPQRPTAFNGRFEISLWEAIVEFFRRLFGG